jgi:hypothetical protein
MFAKLAMLGLMLRPAAAEDAAENLDLPDVSSPHRHLDTRAVAYRAITWPGKGRKIAIAVRAAGVLVFLNLDTSTSGWRR